MQRATDTLARYGGEEFICLLPGIDVEQAEAIARELCSRVESANIPHGRSPASRWVTVSVGVAATVPTEGEPMESLISQADRALYQAKSRGRQIVVYQSELASRAEAELV